MLKFIKKGKKDDPVVIVGMACRVPKARNVEQYWDNLVNGVDAISKVRKKKKEKKIRRKKKIPRQETLGSIEFKRI